MDTTNRPIFPLELLERIVTDDVVEQSGPVALLSASRALRHCAFRHLFKRLEIRISDTEAIKKLSNVICVPDGTVPRLGGLCHYIRDLDVTFESTQSRLDREEDRIYVIRASSACFHDYFDQEAVLNIFTKIVQNGLPRTLLLQVLSHSHHKYSWDLLSARFQCVFLSLIRLPSLTNLDIQHVENLPPELLQTSYLECFSQVHCGPPYSNPASDGVDVRALSEDYPPLNSLVTDHSYSFLGMKKLFRDLKSLRVINSSSHHIPTSWTLIEYAHKTLQELTIVDGPFTYVDLLTPSLSLLPNLQRFNYQAHHVGPRSLCYHTLLLLFTTTGPLSNLHTISIQLDHVYTRSEEAAMALVRPPVWKDLDAHLANPHFSALHTFSVGLKFTLSAREGGQLAGPEGFFVLSNGWPGPSSTSPSTEEASLHTRAAPSFSDSVLDILRTSFVSVKHSKPVERRTELTNCVIMDFHLGDSKQP